MDLWYSKRSVRSASVQRIKWCSILLRLLSAPLLPRRIGPFRDGMGRGPSQKVVLQVLKQTSLLPSGCRAFLGCQGEKAVDELNLSKKIISCHPSGLPLPDHMNCFVALNPSPSRLELSEALL